MLTRRTLLTGAAGLSLASALAGASTTPASQVSKRFPKGFLWGAATAGHQVEGNNVNSDSWLLENAKPTIFAEPSGDACDHYNRFAEDIALLAALGLNTYRFSIEWARIEPEPGAFSLAELEHYRRMLLACHEHGITPFVTFSHFTVPRWFAAQGGWENPASVEHFSRYTERAARHLGDLIGCASTFNEPNLARLLRWLPFFASTIPMVEQMLAAAAKASGSDRFSGVQYVDPALTQDHMIAAHRRAYANLKSGPGKYPVGVSLSIQDDQPFGEHSSRDRKRAEIYDAWLAECAKADFVGVQTYTRALVGETFDMDPPPGAELTAAHLEFWPEALGQTIRYAAAATGKPVYITENGIATDDDTRRIEYIRRALTAVRAAIGDGIDVRGYMHWSLLDNFEWMFGYAPRYGLVSVDRQTFKRTPKPSATYYGQIARHNSL